MRKYLRHDPKELARQTPVSEITDRQAWNFLVTPVAAALLGNIVSSEIELTDKAKLIIPEDKIFNQNDHRLHGGQSDYSRFYYYHSLYLTEKGCLIIRRDGVKLEVLGWHGNLKRQKGQLILRVALRDRRYDGQKLTNDCALEHFPYDDPKLNGNFFPGAKAVEAYLFTYSPGGSVTDSSGDKELNDFIAQPFAYVNKPEEFLKQFKKAWASKRAPGQWSAAIQDAGDTMAQNFDKISQKAGYDVIESACSHYHVAMWCKASGYSFTDPVQDKNFTELHAGIEKIKASGVKLERHHESWVAVLQSLPREFIPDHLYAGGAKWPQDNITLPNLWTWKPLSAKAKSLKPKIAS